MTAVLGVAMALLSGTAASAQNVRITHALFGAHDQSPGTPSYTRIHEGAIRLWDAGVRWEQIETSQGHYNWTRLDQLVTEAQAAHVEVTMVVAMTPHFYAARNTDPPRTIAPYKNFVTALMKRYRNFNGSRGIANYQVWNEPNISNFYSGSMAKMAKLTQAMDQVRDKVDPHARVIAPSLVSRLKFEQKGIAAYYRQHVGGRPVWKYVDALAFSLYPMPKVGGHVGGPEDSISLLNLVKKILRANHVSGSKPIWDTEVNYGLTSGGSHAFVQPLTDSRQAANVMRTYLLSAANGVRRVFWYRYDWGMATTGGEVLGNTRLSNPNDANQVLPAGLAYARVQSWMHGTLVGPSKKLRPCQKDGRGTYTCIVKDATGTRWIYWNPYRKANVRLPKGVHHLQTVLGGNTTVKPGGLRSVTYAPVMVSR